MPRSTRGNEEDIDSLGAFSPAEFQRRFNIGNSKFYDELRSGRLRAVKNGAKTLILYADAKAWAAQLPERA
jgi:hypothetical protein